MDRQAVTSEPGISLRSRGARYVTISVFSLGAVLVYLLSTASTSASVLSRQLPMLLGLGVAIVIGLASIVGYQLVALRRRVRAGVFGSKLTLRLVLLFSLVAVMPGVLVYAVSVQFLAKSIESWIDVRVDKALEGGLSLARANLENMLRELRRKAEPMALALGDPDVGNVRMRLATLRDQAAVHEAALFTPDGKILAYAGETAPLLPPLPPASILRKARMEQAYMAIEPGKTGGFLLRVVVALNKVSGDTVLLQLLHPVPDSIAADAQAVETIYQEYQQLTLSRLGLKRLYGLALTLSLLLAMLLALLMAIRFSERLSAPLGFLEAGTRAVAQGDFSQRHPIRGHDELAILTGSFNTMTRQLADAKEETERKQQEVNSAKAYLEGVLGNLSAGVVSFDQNFKLRAANRSAQQILGVDMQQLMGFGFDQGNHSRLSAIAHAVEDGFASAHEESWARQVEVPGVAGTQVLLLRGTRLTLESQPGYVLVFDDITHLLQAQRYAAWGEVAQRLAHEIKNPLTPIQLSAERLHQRLVEKLGAADADMLTRSTRTIVTQVAALKNMVDAFSRYARSPEPNMQLLDLNRLVPDVLDLYDLPRHPVRLELDAHLPPITGDATRLRQVIHNLLQNSAHAVVDRADAEIVITTSSLGDYARLIIRDNGSGFPEQILARVFEPYVTTKTKGTGLGLAIVKKIVEEHAGRIEVSNLHPRGASVCVWLPLASGTVQQLASGLA
jgi:nitrogen fixation/metabolism regulation signal transduction histidine kinase